MLQKQEGQAITEDEAALYDRQIRLWGLDAQRRLRASRVLLVGISGLGAEVAKNLTLAGVKSVTILDHTDVTEEDRCSQFLVSRDDVGKNRAECSQPRAQQLNPMVDVSADSGDVASKDEEYFTQFDVICATCCPRSQLLRLNRIAHKNNIQFYAGDVWGYYGYMFADLNQHEYAEEVPAPQKKSEAGSGEPAAKKAKTEAPETVVVKKKATFSRLSKAFELDWSEPTLVRRLKRTPITYFIIQVLHEFRESQGRDPAAATLDDDMAQLLKDKVTIMERLQAPVDTISDTFSRHCVAELSPVCAVVGGILGQEIIKAVSQKDQPHNNFFFFNGIEGSGMVDCIGGQ